MKERLVIGIAGGSGSGKTTLADNIAAYFGPQVALLRHDSYYKPMKDLPHTERATVNYDHPDAFDTDLLISHLESLKRGEAIEAPIYQYHVHDRSKETRHVEPAEVILLEGILVFENAHLRSLMDLKIYVDTDPDVRIVRRILRDVSERGRTLQSVAEQYLTTVKPMHDAFIEPSKKYADVIIPEGGQNPAAYGMIIQKIAAHLAL